MRLLIIDESHIESESNKKQTIPSSFLTWFLKIGIFYQSVLAPNHLNNVHLKFSRIFAIYNLINHLAICRHEALKRGIFSFNVQFKI